MPLSRRPATALIALCALIALALFGLYLQLDLQAEHNEELSALQQALIPLLQQGQSRGYQSALQQHRPADGLLLILRDREGHTLAAWPPPVSASRWKIFAQALQNLRQGLFQLLGHEQNLVLKHNGQRVGELQLYRARGVVGMNLTSWLFFAIALLAVLGLLALRRSSNTLTAPPADSSPPNSPVGLALLPSLGKAMDEAELGLLALDSQARVISMNQVAQRLSAWSVADAHGLPVASVLRVRLSAEPTQPVDLGSYSDKGLRQGFELHTRNDAVIPLEISCLPLVGSSALADTRLLLLRDISAQQTELLRFRQDAQLAAATLDLMNEGLAICNTYGRITRANRTLRQLTGYSAQELQGMTVAKLMPVPFLRDSNIQLANYLPGHPGPRLPVVAWRKNATTFAVDLQVQQLAEGEQAYLLLLSDKAQQQKNAALAGRLSVLMAHMPHSLLLVDAQSAYCNGASPHALSLLGYAQEQLQRMSLSHLLADLADDDVRQHIDTLRSGAQTYLDSSQNLQLADGRIIRARLRLVLSRDEEPPELLVFISPD